ncbi:MAG: hypothetical protein IPK56_11490 [Elusimicrobia bacterium]|nr:hypothetical protein [Elusimicrobiota bacterium]
MTRHLTLAEYGTVALVGIAVLVLDGAFGLGTANSMGILYGRETDPARRAEILWSNVLLLAVHTTLLALVGAALARPWRGVLGADGLAPVVSLAFGTLALKTVAVPVLNGLRLERRRRVYVAMNVGGAFFDGGVERVRGGRAGSGAHGVVRGAAPRPSDRHGRGAGGGDAVVAVPVDLRLGGAAGAVGRAVGFRCVGVLRAGQREPAGVGTRRRARRPGGVRRGRVAGGGDVLGGGRLRRGLGAVLSFVFQQPARGARGVRLGRCGCTSGPSSSCRWG